jgi:mRNA-degrading endonuclease toxin of MazEF toxin-antitoxin module
VKQWDTFDCEFAHGKHPCIIVSPTDRCQNADFLTVNVLACQSHRAQRLPRENELLVNGADGMDWETLVRCDFIWVARKSDLKHRRGRVTAERRRALGQKLIRIFGFWLD